ncbi:MAG: hypothetical protein GY705_09045 [Bacteroidetes bacterium]|nr:hypothetical protein [Bacteroidota bacterium]
MEKFNLTSQMSDLIRVCTSSGLLTKNPNKWYPKHMSKPFASFFIIISLVSVQAFGLVCETKCSLNEAGVESNMSQDVSHSDCHSNSEEESNDSDSEECNKVCAVDEIFTDIKTLNVEAHSKQAVVFTDLNKYLSLSSDLKETPIRSISDPPFFGIKKAKFGRLLVKTLILKH